MFGAKPAGGSVFGQSNTNASGGGLFGGQQNTPTTGGGLFGSKPAASGGLFGGQQSGQAQQGGGLFGQQNQQNTSGGGLFGNKPTGPTTTNGGGLFGNKPATGGGLFGGQQQQTQQQQQPQPSQLGAAYLEPNLEQLLHWVVGYLVANNKLLMLEVACLEVVQHRQVGYLEPRQMPTQPLIPLRREDYLEVQQQYNNSHNKLNKHWLASILKILMVTTHFSNP